VAQALGARRASISSAAARKSAIKVAVASVMALAFQVSCIVLVRSHSL
jgi:hypothetical protein